MADKEILVIDSDNDTAQTIVWTLESEGYLVFVASTGAFAVTMARRIQPSLIVINLAMADVNALDLCRTIHGMRTLKDVPIVAISSSEEDTDRSYSECGIVDSLRKPISLEELIAKIDSLFSTRAFDAGPVTAEDAGLGEAEEEGERTEAPEIWRTASENKDASEEGIAKTDRIIIRLREKEEEKREAKEPPQETPKISDEPPGSESLSEWMNDSESPHEDAGTADSEKKDERGEGEEDRAMVQEEITEKRKGAKRLLVPIVLIVVAIVVLVASGVVIFKKGPGPGTKVKETVSVKTSLPDQQKSPEAPSPQVQEPQQATAPDKRLTSSPAAPPVPAPPQPPVASPAASSRASSAVETKPSGKAAYSVQIGAFKSEKNADALVKQYKEMGYEAFLYASPQKDKELLHRVLVGRFEDRREAAKLAAEINSKQKVKTVVYKE